MIRKIIFVSLLALQSSICNAVLLIDSQSVIVDMQNQEVLFTIVFNRNPDFYTLDEYSRPADAFQYYIDFDCSPIYQGDNFIETLIRGSEIHAYGQIPLRNQSGSSSDPTSGGWGEIRALVPYQLQSRTLTFSASLEAIGDLDGQFGYALYLGEYGAATDWLYVPNVPEPATILLLGLGGITLLRRRGR